MPAAIKVGVSACLLGEPVRYDGGHKHDHYITGTLGNYFSLVPVCPEVECGMTTPREAMRLEGDPAAPRLMTRVSRLDKTEQMLAFCDRKLHELEQMELCGFICKKNSPSCGLIRVNIYGAAKMPVKRGSGIFAAAVAGHFPLLPLEEEWRLCDPAIRENFIERVFSCRRWKAFLGADFSVGGLVEFHTAHKLLLMAHSPQVYRALGALVASGSELDSQLLISCYEELFMKGLSLQATVKKHTNVLQHIMGYFKKLLSPAEKEELLALIMEYHAGAVPLLVPLSLISHYVEKYNCRYLQQQVYLEPYPAELMRRNQV